MSRRFLIPLSDDTGRKLEALAKANKLNPRRIAGHLLRIVLEQGVIKSPNLPDLSIEDLPPMPDKD